MASFWPLFRLLKAPEVQECTNSFKGLSFLLKLKNQLTLHKLEERYFLIGRRHLIQSVVTIRAECYLHNGFRSIGLAKSGGPY